MVQAYSALPFNITSGVTTIQGTAGRPIVDGAFIPRNAGIGPDFFSSALRLSRAFALGGRTRLEGARRGVQPDQPHQRRDGPGQLRRGRLSGQSDVELRHPTAVGDPASAQFGVRVRF